MIDEYDYKYLVTTDGFEYINSGKGTSYTEDVDTIEDSVAIVLDAEGILDDHNDYEIDIWFEKDEH